MEDSREQDANVLSDWSGSMTPPLMESDDEILESQCVVPLQKKNFEDISIIAKENELLPNFECKEFSLEFRNDAILEMFQRGNNDEESVVQELRALISSIGRIHNHAVLEAYWHASTILTSLSLKDNATRFTCISTLEEYFTVIIWDLAVLALNMFTNMVLFVIHVSDKLSSTENCQGFWSLFSGVCSCLLDTSTKSAIEEDYFSKKAPPGFSVNEPITFAWWLLKMVAPLYKYDIGGTLVYKENMYLPSNWLLIQDLLKSTFNTKGPDTKESSAREALSTCLEVAAIWNPNPDVITYLWGYFCKRLLIRYGMVREILLHFCLDRLKGQATSVKQLRDVPSNYRRLLLESSHKKRTRPTMESIKGKTFKKTGKRGYVEKKRERWLKGEKGRQKGEKGRERERKGEKGRERERKGEKGRERERKGVERELKGEEGGGREERGRKGEVGRERKRKEEKGRERKRKEEKGRERERKGEEGRGRARKGEEEV
eukprot:gene17306-8884_t